MKHWFTDVLTHREWLPLEIICTEVATNMFNPLRGRWVALLSIGIIFVYRIAALNLPLSRIPTPSMTHLFIIWLICVKTRVYKAARLAWTPFTLLSAPKTTRNTPHPSAVFPCIPIDPNRWHLLIENRWSRLYADWYAAPLAPVPVMRYDCRYTSNVGSMFEDIPGVYLGVRSGNAKRSSGLNVISQRWNV